MKVETAITEQEQALLDYQQVAIQELDIFPQLSVFLQGQEIDTLAPILNMNLSRLGDELGLQEDAAEYLLQQIDHYFENQPILPFVCPTLPCDCFQKSLDVLDLPSQIKEQLEKSGIHRLGLLASLDPGENNPLTKMVQEGLTRYVKSYRATTEASDSQSINVSYKHTALWSLPQPEPLEKTGTPLDVLDLPTHLSSYIHNLGIERVEQLADLSHQEMKLLLGLEHDAVDFLYATVNQFLGKVVTSEEPLAALPELPSATEPLPLLDAVTDLPSQAVTAPLPEIEPEPLTAAPVALPDFCQTSPEPEEQQRLLLKYGQGLPVLSETLLLQLLVDKGLLDSEQVEDPPGFEGIAQHLLSLWELSVDHMDIASEQERRTLKVLHVHTFGELLETIMVYNLQWLKENASQEISPPNLGLTPLLIYIKQMREHRQPFLGNNWLDKVRHTLVKWYRQLTQKDF